MKRFIFFYLAMSLFLSACAAETAVSPSTSSPLPNTQTPIPNTPTPIPSTATPIPPTPSPNSTTPPPIIEESATISEIAIIEIALDGPITSANSELSGLAWYGDTLILLPQYPGFSGEETAVYAIPKATIEAYLDGTATDPITPMSIPVEVDDLGNLISRPEGYESIDFIGDDAYLTIEASGGGMRAYLIKGTMAPDLSLLILDASNLTKIERQAELGNTSDEALLIADNQIVTFYEANGVEVNEAPMVHLFNTDLDEMGTASFPNIPYRITDVTSLDENGRFWAINYNFPGTPSLQTDHDPIAATYGAGITHAQSEIVERLVEFQYAPEGITLIEQAPIQLQLIGEEARNWEGIVRLDDRGFLLVTDKFPATILGFVPYEK